MNYQLIISNGDEAWKKLWEPKFLEDWNELYKKCFWSTSMQTPEFVTVWFENYKKLYTPIVIHQRDEANNLVGLLILAKNINEFVVAGAHQAEYQVWIANEQHSETFINNALYQLDKQFSGIKLNFRYLPKNTPIESIATGSSNLYLFP